MIAYLKQQGAIATPIILWAGGLLTTIAVTWGGFLTTMQTKQADAITKNTADIASQGAEIKGIKELMIERFDKIDKKLDKIK